MTFKPMLAYTIEDVGTISFPALASIKLDGIRCVIVDGVAYSRSMKPIRNRFVQWVLGRVEFNGLDGELVVGNVFAKDCYSASYSGVMSEEGKPDFTFYVFDSFSCPTHAYSDRIKGLAINHPRIMVLDQELVQDQDSLLAYEQVLLAKGAEGVMVRDPKGKYKFGRSTAREGLLGKLKRFVDAEYKVVGFTERMHNTNEAVVNALGYTERSSHKANMVGRGDLGTLICEMQDGTTFEVGTGFDDATRAEIWSNQPQYLGKMAKVKSFPVGVKDRPRFPVWLGWRHDEDM